MNKDFQNILGLKKGETSITETLVSAKNPLSVSELARISGVPRTTILPSLQRLAQRSLVTPIKIGKRNKWILSDKYPQNKSTIAYSSEKTEVKVYKGSKAVFDVWRSLSRLPKYTRLYAIQSERSFNSAIAKGFDDAVKVNENIRKNKIIMEGIVHESWADNLSGAFGGSKATKLFESFVGRLADTEKLPDGFLDVDAELYFAKDTVYITNWTDEVILLMCY